MEKELKLLLPLLHEGKKGNVEGHTLHYGIIGNCEVAIMQCGIGKVNAALTTDCAIRTFKPDMVLNSGVAGGADASMNVLDVVVATNVAYHDVWCGPGTQWGAAAGLEVMMGCDKRVAEAAERRLNNDTHLKFGLICSGDIFVSREEEVAIIKKHFPKALAVDMESGAVAQTCLRHNVPFGVIRVISDTPGQADNISQYENFWTDAPKATFEALKGIISEL